MPRRKRIDPVDAPIDGGEPTKEVVLGKDPSKHYAWIHPDDLGTVRQRGMTKTDRQADGPKAVADIYDEGEIRVGDLILMEMDKVRHESIEARNVAEFNRRRGNERRNVEAYAKNNPGSQYKEERVSA